MVSTNTEQDLIFGGLSDLSTEYAFKCPQSILPDFPPEKVITPTSPPFVESRVLRQSILHATKGMGVDFLKSNPLLNLARHNCMCRTELSEELPVRVQLLIKLKRATLLKRMFRKFRKPDGNW